MITKIEVSSPDEIVEIVEVNAIPIDQSHGDDENFASNYDKDAVRSEKFTRDMWNQCEKPLHEEEKKKCMMIVELGKNTGSLLNLDLYNRSKLTTIGELYKLVRISVKNSGLLKLPAIDTENEESDNDSENESNNKKIKKKLKVITLERTHGKILKKKRKKLI